MASDCSLHAVSLYLVFVRFFKLGPDALPRGVSFDVFVVHHWLASCETDGLTCAGLLRHVAHVTLDGPRPWYQKPHAIHISNPDHATLHSPPIARNLRRLSHISSCPHDIMRHKCSAPFSFPSTPAYIKTPFPPLPCIHKSVKTSTSQVLFLFQNLHSTLWVSLGFFDQWVHQVS